jgi:hypothetical protein
MKRFSTLVAACTVGASVPVHAALFGVASFSPFGSQSLYAIDAATGVATLVGSTGLRQISGLSWDSVQNRLVALTVAGDQFAIDTATGASTLLVDSSFGVPEGSIAFNGGTAYSTLFDNLHSWNGSAWTQVGTSGLAAGADISGLDFGGGLLLGLAVNGGGADELVSFDVSTGAATVVGATGTNAASVAGLAYGFTAGSWFMTDGDALYTVDEASGAASLVGAHGVSGFSGLAFVPSPGVVALLALSGLVAKRRRNRN